MRCMFRGLLALVLVLGTVIGHAADSVEVIDIRVSGMTCPFCVHGVKKQLEKLPGVDKAQVSLDKKFARITLQPGQTSDLAAIRRAIVEAGFTPGKVLSVGSKADGKQ